MDSKHIRTRLLKLWHSMRARCENERNISYEYYGARGIKVCEQWNSFDNFYRWALESEYKPGLQIDRVLNNGNYEPSNCRWVTPSENSMNRRSNILITIDGTTKTQKQWADDIGCSDKLIHRWREEHGDRYAAQRIKEAIATGDYRLHEYVNKPRTITHIESGKTFSSASEAARAFGMCPSSINEAIREREGKTKAGTFVRG